MKNRVELLAPEVRPRVELISLNFLIFSATLSIIVVALLYFWASSESAYWQNEQLAKQQQVTRLKTMIDELKAKADEAPSQELVEQVRMMQRQASEQRFLLDELARREQQQGEGYAELMQGLASIARKEVWLTAVNFHSDKIELKGKTSDPDILPVWIEGLSSLPQLDGKQFNNVLIESDPEGAFQSFSLSTE